LSKIKVIVNNVKNSISLFNTQSKIKELKIISDARYLQSK